MTPTIATPLGPLPATTTVRRAGISLDWEEAAMLADFASEPADIGAGLTRPIAADEALDLPLAYARALAGRAYGSILLDGGAEPADAAPIRNLLAALTAGMEDL